MFDRFARLRTAIAASSQRYEHSGDCEDVRLDASIVPTSEHRYAGSIRRTIVLCFTTMALGGSIAFGKENGSPLHAVNDPGDTPPATSDAEYEPYRLPGTSDISAKIVLREPPYRNFICNTPLLYPVTPFTTWLLRKWAYEADGKQTIKEHLDFPGDRGMHVRSPSDVVTADNATGDAVARGECRNFENYTLASFAHVPVGAYYLVEMIQRPVVYYDKNTQNATAYGPDGAMPAYVDTYRERVRGGDGFIVASGVLDVKRAGRHYDLLPSGTFPLAWFRDE